MTDKPEVIPKVRVADNTGVEQFWINTAPFARIHPFGWQGGFRHNGQYEVSEQVRSWANTGVVRVSRGVLHLEPVP